jgi:hypothetical protein
MKYYISQAPANPITRFIAALVASVCLVGAFFFGLVILAVVAVLIAFFGLVLWMRSWWLARRNPDASVVRESQARSGEVLEGEYTVISERRD